MVESRIGAVAWGLLANAPFPILARRTGRADFRHPALRLASPRGTRRGSSGHAFEARQAAFSVNDITREADGAAPGHLVPSGEEVAHTFIDIAVDSAECRANRSVAEVVR